jgi:endoglucanase
MTARWGFDFARLPLSYWCWSEPDNPFRMREEGLREVDRAVELGRAHRVHVNLNLHRAPGYCVNPPAEPRSLWTDPRALDAFAFQWAFLAGRYKGIPSTELSFDLLNEPANVDEATYVRVMTHTVERIRAADPDRLIVVDGLRYGREPVHGLAGLGVAQSTRGYDPMPVSHAGASWVPSAEWPAPAWPFVARPGDRWDRARLRAEVVGPWKALADKGVGVHVGEWGVYNRTPHAVALAYMRDYLAIWKELGWGWALWNLRGAFGILDSGRTDVAYEPFEGHKLDRRMLELLQAG